MAATAGCRATKREEAAAPVAAVDEASPAPPGSKVAAVDLYAGTRPAAAASGQVVTGFIPMADGRFRGYRLYVPASLADGAEAPLVVALHGGGGTAEQFERSAGFDGLAEANRFFVVYPDGVGSGPGEALVRTWNAGTCCGAAAEQQVDDVGFVGNLVDTLTGTRPVDRGRVYVIGHSNGGMLAYRLACQLADRVAAVGVQAGALAVDSCASTHPVSLLHLHGTGDENVPIDGGLGIRARAGVSFRPAQESVGMVAAAAGCQAGSASTTTDPGNPDLATSAWSGCPAGVDARLIAVDGASHAWMGHDRGPLVEGLVGEPYPDLDASRALWSFVSAHDRT